MEGLDVNGAEVSSFDIRDFVELKNVLYFGRKPTVS
jgi:hypothetical protein